LTGTEGKQAKESIDINKSLFTLRQVINVLSENANPRTKKEDKVYVPYRDSKLTSILKQSIGGNSFCLMIACINPNDSFLD
jgi:kinesin family protein 4/21/27